MSLRVKVKETSRSEKVTAFRFSRKPIVLMIGGREGWAGLKEASLRITVRPFRGGSDAWLFGENMVTIVLLGREESMYE
jgi:hypothetical protein